MSDTILKAGFIPYIFENGKPVFMFMTPSDPAYGGTRPGIAKGHIDAGEKTLDAAIREAGEELGLKQSCIMWETVQCVYSGLPSSYPYHLTVFIGEVTSKTDFNAPDYETGSVHWLTVEEFSKVGRTDQTFITKKAGEALNAKETT